MARHYLPPLAWMLGAALSIVVVGEARSAGSGHGGGSGHALAGPGFYGRGCGGHYGYGRGIYGYGRGYYGYPGYYGVGLGFGLGYGYGYGYGYPYAYAYPPGYGYPVYVEVNGAPPPVVAAQGGAVSKPPSPPGDAAGSGPFRLTDSDLLLSIHVPADAVVRINGTPTAQNGPRREFVSTGLSPGRSYTFVVDAHWKGPNGQAVDLERRLRVVGGERRSVDFTSPHRGD